MKQIIKCLITKGSEHFFYVGATLITAMVHFLYSVYAKAYIEPLEFGIYSTCLLLKTYFSYMQLGVLNAFNRDYPQLVGAKEDERARQHRNTTFTYLLYVYAALSVIISVIVIFVGKIYCIDNRYTYGLVFCAVITATSVIENFLCSCIRIDGGFKFVSVVIIVESLTIIVGFIIIPIIGYYSLYIITLGSPVVGIIMYYRRGMAGIKIRADRILLKNIIFSGLPLLINNLIWTIIDSIDKFVILNFMDAEKLGLYSIAQMAFSYMILIPTAMSQLFYVNIGKIYGAKKSKKDLNEAAIQYTLVIAIVISFLVLAAYFFMDPLVSFIMPKYSKGVRSSQILMLALAIYTPTMVNGNILTILKKNAALLRSSIYLCILNVVCSIGFVKIIGVRIESVALGTAVSYLIRTLILIVQLKREAGSKVINMIKASIIPVLIISGPGIAIYHTLNNSWRGFIIALLIAMMITFMIYRKKLLIILRG